MQAQPEVILLVFALMALSCGDKRESQGAVNRPSNWTTTLTRATGVEVSKSMILDSTAHSINPGKPAFMAPPPGEKAYYGFPLVKETSTDGFTMGVVTDYLEMDSPDGCTIGDAFVEGPDGTRAGIIWEVGQTRLFSTVVEPDKHRWGVYHFFVPEAVRSLEDFRHNFLVILPKIKRLYQQTRQPEAQEGVP